MTGSLLLMMSVQRQSPEEKPIIPLQSCQRSSLGMLWKMSSGWLKPEELKEQQKAALETIGKNQEGGRKENTSEDGQNWRT